MSENLPDLQWPNPADDSEYLKSLHALFSNDDFPWDFIIEKMPTARVHNYYGPFCFYDCDYNRAIYIDCGKWKRNEILRQLQNDTNFEIVKGYIVTGNIKNDILFFGYVVEIRYKTHLFTWTPTNGDFKSCIKYKGKNYVYEIDSIIKLQEGLNELLDE